MNITQEPQSCKFKYQLYKLVENHPIVMKWTLELQKQSAVVRSPLDKERVAREIESTDKAIDRLVYELSRKGMIYGLTEEEIRIVEGG
jgi:hypothetical protein